MAQVLAELPDGGKCIESIIEVVNRGDEASTEGHEEGGQALETGSTNDSEWVDEHNYRQPDIDYNGWCFDGFAYLTCRRVGVVCVECGLLVGLK